MDNAVPTAGRTDEWRVECIDDDGAVEVTLFSGQRSEQRAKDYAAALNRGRIRVIAGHHPTEGT